MVRPHEVLSPDDYKNYRNIRSVAALFIVLGCIFLFAAIGFAFGESSRPRQWFEPIVAIGFAVVGLCGAIGGIAARRGNRRWAPLVYVMAVLYLFAFPIGTILSYVMLSGLSRYLDSMDRVRDAESG